MVNKLDYGEFLLNTAITNSASLASLSITARYTEHDLTKDRATGLLSVGKVTITNPNDLGEKESFYFSASAANGTDSLSRAKYTLTIGTADDASTKRRGTANDDDGTDAVANVISGNMYAFPKNSPVRITWEVGELTALETTFTAGSTTNTSEAGEDIEALDSVSLHTDGKLYEYLSTTYPNLVGAVSTAYATGATATYTTFGGLSTGHSGLTIGATQYAEDTGTITETPSATTTVLGVAESATTIRVVKPGDAVAEASQAQAEGGTVQGVYSSPLRVKQAIDAFAGAGVVSAELAENLVAGDPVVLYDDSGTTKCAKPDAVAVTDNWLTGNIITKGVIEISRRKFVAIYTDQGDSSDLKAAVLSINEVGTTVTAGASVDVEIDSFGTGKNAIAKIADDKFAVVYTNSTDTETQAIVGTVSGTTITMGSSVTLDADSDVDFEGICKVDTDKFAAVYADDTTTVDCIVCTVSGTVITPGTTAQVAAVTGHRQGGIQCVQLTTDKIAITYCDAATPDSFEMKVATISGTTPSFGTAAVIETSTGGFASNGFDLQSVNAETVIATYEDTDDSKSYVIAASVSGTTITGGTQAATAVTSVAAADVVIGSDGTHYFVAKDVADSDKLKYETFTLEGRVITLSGDTVTMDAGDTNTPHACPVSEGGFFCTYTLDAADDGLAYALLEERGNVVGLMAEAGSTAETKDVAILGNVVSGLSSISPGSKYYIDSSASLVTGGGTYGIGMGISTTQIAITKSA
tara:strand:- start:10358 stop:12613 length:2256 start_codon:yes stop_codon:yes gene_type:complete